jgi:SAM-dependent methyltransferase
MSTVNWEEAGRGWGARAEEWAYLFEPYARPANELLFDRLEIGDGARLLDIACGSGFAAHLAAERQAQVSYNRNLWMHHLTGDATYLPV